MDRTRASSRKGNPRDLFSSMRLALMGVLVLAVLLIGVKFLPDRRGVPTTASTAVEEGSPTATTDDAEALRGRQWDAAMRFDSYLAAMARESDFGLVRWQDRTDDPLLVYVPESTLRGYTPGHRRAALEAFARWSRVSASVIPVVFTFVRDSARANVMVEWVPFLEDGKAGRATITRDANGWIQSGRLALGLGVVSGGIYDADATYTIALHEIGHLLGLGHSDDPGDVMYPTTHLQDLSTRDRTTARLLYQILPGPIPGR